MIAYKEQYVIDDAGNRVGVLLNIDDYQRILNELEELESIRAYDAAKAPDNEEIPFNQAVREIEQDR